MKVYEGLKDMERGGGLREEDFFVS